MPQSRPLFFPPFYLVCMLPVVIPGLFYFSSGDENLNNHDQDKEGRH